MTISYLQRAYVGSAVAGTLSAALTSSATTFQSSTSMTGMTDLTGNNFAGNLVVTVDYGTANAEKILCTFNSSTGVFTIVTRNYDGGSYNTATPHASGTLFVVTASATEAAEANAAVQSMKHILTGGSSGTSASPANIAVDGTPSIGTATVPAHGDHSHSIPSTALSGWLSAATFTLGSGVSVPVANLQSGTLPSGVTVPLASIASGNLPASVSTSNVWTIGPWASGTAPISTAITGYNDYIIVVTANATASTAANLYLNVNTSASSSMTSPTSRVATAQWATTTGSTALHNLSCSGAYSPGSTTTFYIQAALTASSGTATTNAVTVTVIGIN